MCVSFPLAVQITSKQLEAEKEYLEEELKRRGKRKQAPPSSTQSQPSSFPAKATTSTVHEDSAKENMTSEPTSDLGKLVLPLRTHKDINILEDLDRELNENTEGFLSCLDSGGDDHRLSLDRRAELATESTGSQKLTVSL